MYTIGQVSEQFDLPVSTLRYYDKEGLFPALTRKVLPAIYAAQTKKGFAQSALAILLSVGIAAPSLRVAVNTV